MNPPLAVSVLPVLLPDKTVAYFWSAKQSGPWLEPAVEAARSRQCGGPFASHIEAYSDGLNVFPNRVARTLAPVHHSSETGALWVAFPQSFLLTVEAPLNTLAVEAAQAKPRPSVRRATEPVPKELEMRRKLTFELEVPESEDWTCTLDLNALEFIYGRVRDEAVTLVYRVTLYFVGHEALDWPSLWGTVKIKVKGVAEMEGTSVKKVVELA